MTAIGLDGVTVELGGRVVVDDVSASVDVGRSFKSIEDTAYSLRLRLRLVWNNSSWETYLSRPKGWTANYEATFATSGEMTLLRGSGAAR